MVPRLHILPCSPGQTFWEDVLHRCEIKRTWNTEQLRTHAIHLTRHAADLQKSAAFVLIENNYLCKDHRSTNPIENPWRKFPPDSYCTRLHWFNKGLPAKFLFESNPDIETLNKLYIGYNVLLPNTKHIWGRCLLNPHAIQGLFDARYYVSTTTEPVNINGIELTANGYPMTGHTETDHCTHTSLWNILRYGFLTDGHPTQVLQGEVHARRKEDGNIKSVLEDIRKHNFTAAAMLRTPENKSFENDLYTYCESGMPIFLFHNISTTEQKDHAITIIGHTHPPDLSTVTLRFPNEDGFYNASEFVRQYVTIDNNYFPYRLLGVIPENTNYGKEYFPKSQGHAIFSCAFIDTFFIHYPSNISIDHRSTYSISRNILTEIQKNIPDQQLILRTLLTRSNRFKTQKRKELDRNKENLTILNTTLPKYLWIIELSTRQQYNQGSITAEIVINPMNCRTDSSAICYVKIGSHILGSLEPQAIGKCFTKEPKVYKHYASHDEAHS